MLQLLGEFAVSRTTSMSRDLTFTNSTPKPVLPKSSHAASKPSEQHPQQPTKRPGLLGLLTKFGKSHDKLTPKRPSIANPESDNLGPVRSLSDAGPTTKSPVDEDGMHSLEPVRSKSIGAILEPVSLEEQMGFDGLTLQPKENVVVQEKNGNGEIIRHDQYQGIARTETRDLRQPGVNYE
jgi:hypothetical protein